MNNEITSKILGKLKQYEDFDDWWISDEFDIPFFGNKKLAIMFMDFNPQHDETFIEEADSALANFLKLNTEDRNNISGLAYENCMDFLNMIDFDEADEPLRQIKNKNDIWNFIQPSEIYVTRRYKDRDIYVQIACGCDWEQEHGLQFVFKQGKKLTRISDQDGHLTEADAYALPDSEDKLLSQFDNGNNKSKWWKFWE